MRWKHLAGWLGAAALLGSGCATSGNDQLVNTVYSMNRKITNIDQNLTPTVTKLNETVVNMGARVDAVEQSSQTQATTLETMQRQLQEMKATLDDIHRRGYAKEGLTPPRSSSSIPSVSGSGMEITPTAPPGGPVPPGALEDSTSMSMGDDTVGDLNLGGANIATSAPSSPSPPAPASRTVAGDERQLFEAAEQSFQQQKFDEAAKLFGEYIEKFPNSTNSADARYWRATAMYRMDQFDAAAREYEKVRKSHPDSTRVPAAMYQEAASLLKLGKQDEAMKLLNQLIDNYPTSLPAKKAKTQLERSNLRQ